MVVGFLGNMNFNVLNKAQDNDGQILILDVKVDDTTSLLNNVYNSNKECDQLNVLTTLYNLLSNITNLHWRGF